MAFYICLALAAVVTVSGITYYYKNRKTISLLETPVHALLVLALADTCILYIPWFLHMWKADSIHEGRSLVFLPFMIVRLMQTVSLDADYEAALEMIEFANSSGVSVRFLEIYAIILSYVSVLVPLSGILTIMNFFGNQIRFGIASSRLSRKKNIYIFNGVGERNMELALSIRNRPDYNKRDCSFLYCNVREEPGAEVKRKIRETGGWYSSDYPSALLRLVLYKKDRKTSFFLLEDDKQNFDDAIGILNAAGSKNGDGSKWENADRVSIHMLLASNELADILDAQKKYGIFVRVMDVERLYVQDLFRRLPLFSCLSPAKRELRLTIFGTGRVAEEVLMCSLWMGCLASAALKIRFVSKEAEAVRGKLRAVCPALFDLALAGGERFDISFDACPDGSTRRNGLTESDYLVLAGESDEENIRAAMYFRTWFARQIPEDESQPLIAVCVRDGRRAEQAENLCIQESRESYGLHVFGTEVRLFTAENILFSRLAQSLYRIQLSYGLADPDDTPTPEQKNDAWMALNRSIYNYRNCEAGATYIANRLFDSGAVEECMRASEATQTAASEATQTAASDAAQTAASKATQTAASAESERTCGRYSGYEQALFLTEAIKRASQDGDRTVLNSVIDAYEQKIRDPEVFDLLARTEHRRWIAYMACNGWIRLPKEKLRTWMENNGGSHKDYLRLRHACMAGWDELEELSLIKTDGRDAEQFKAPDRLMVRGLRNYIV